MAKVVIEREALEPGDIVECEYGGTYIVTGLINESTYLVGLATGTGYKIGGNTTCYKFTGKVTLQN